MGFPLSEQCNNQHTKAEALCEGCWGSGWLTSLVDDDDQLEQAGKTEPCDFLMKCDECEAFDDDESAIVAAKQAGMNVDDHGVVTYTETQLDFIRRYKRKRQRTSEAK